MRQVVLLEDIFTWEKNQLQCYIGTIYIKRSPFSFYQRSFYVKKWAPNLIKEIILPRLQKKSRSTLTTN